MPERVKIIGNLFNGKVPAGAVYVGRASVGLKQSPFANPWVVRPAVHSIDGTTQGWVVSNHRKKSDIAGHFSDRNLALSAAVGAFATHLDRNPALRERVVAELAGKDLACWCKLPPTGEPDRCHAAYLLEVANPA